MYLNRSKLPIFLCWTFFSTYYANELTNDERARTQQQQQQQQQIGDTYRIESLRDLQQDQENNLCSREEVELKASVLLEWKADDEMTVEQYAILEDSFRSSYQDVNLCDDSRTIENVAISPEGTIQVTGTCINCPENTGLFQYTTPSYGRRSMTAVQESTATTQHTIENLSHTVPGEFVMERLRGRTHNNNNNNNRKLYDFETQTHSNPNFSRSLQGDIDMDETCSDGPLSVFNSDVIIDIDLRESSIESVTDDDKKALATSFKNTYNQISGVLCGEVDRVVTEVMVDNVIMLPSGPINTQPPSARFTLKVRGTCQQCLNREGLFQDASNVFTGGPRRYISFDRAQNDQDNSPHNVCGDEPVYGTDTSLDIELIGDRNRVTSAELGVLSSAFTDAYNELAGDCGQGFRILYDSEFDTFSDSPGQRRVQVNENFRARMKVQGACRGCRKNPNLLSNKQNRRLKNTPENEQFLRSLETKPESECLDEPQNDFESIVRLDLIGNENDAGPAELQAIATAFERTYNNFVQIWCGDDIRRITEVTLEEEIGVAEARINSFKQPRRFLVRVRGFCRSCADSFNLFRVTSDARRLNRHTEAHSSPAEEHFEHQSDLHSTPKYYRQGDNGLDSTSATQPPVIPSQSLEKDSDLLATRQFSKEDTCDVNSLSPFYSTIEVEYLGYQNSLTAQELTALGEGFLEAYNKISDDACPQGFRSVEAVFTDISETPESRFLVYDAESDTSNNSSSTAGNIRNSIPNTGGPKRFVLLHRVSGTCRQCPSTRRFFSDASNTRKLVAVDDANNLKTHGRVRGAKPSRRLQSQDLKTDKKFTAKRRIGGPGGERISKGTPKTFSRLRKPTECNCEGPSRIAFAQVYNNTIQKLQDEGRLQNILTVTDGFSIYENVTSFPPTDKCECSGPTTTVFAEALDGAIQEFRAKGVLENISGVVDADNSVLEISGGVKTCECESPDATELAIVFNRSIEALIEYGTLSNIAGVTGKIEEPDAPRLSLQCGCDSLTTSQFVVAYKETIQELVNNGVVQSITRVSEHTSISENVTAVPNGEIDSCICDAPLFETFINTYTSNIQTLIDENQLPQIVFEDGKLESPTSLPKDLPTSQPTPTQFPTLLPTSMPTDVPTPFPSTDTPSQMPTAKPTLRIVGRDAPSTDSPTLLLTALPTLPPTVPPTSTPPTSSPSLPPTSTPTVTPTPPLTTSRTLTPTVLPTALPTQPPTASPTQPPTTLPPTTKPTLRIVGRDAPSTDSPTLLLTSLPTLPPTVSPTSTPPTSSPSLPPTSAPPTLTPTTPMTTSPTLTPTVLPTALPTQPPTASPTQPPTTLPPTTKPTLRIVGRGVPSTDSPTLLLTALPTLSPTVPPTSTPPTSSPSLPPTLPPSLPPTSTSLPTMSPTPSPTPLPTSPPTASPTFLPTQPPTSSPTSPITQPPIKNPALPLTLIPTPPPTTSPTVLPTALPTQQPTLPPSVPPTPSPTSPPTTLPPTSKPTLRIIGRLVPSTDSPTLLPPSLPHTSTSLPTRSPTLSPTPLPTYPSTVSPTFMPTQNPTLTPTLLPSSSPTLLPTALPTQPPTTSAPTLEPTPLLTTSPTLTPTVLPSALPTQLPIASPTQPPTTLPPTTKPTLRIVGRGVPSTDSPTLSPIDLQTLPPTQSVTLSPTSSPTPPPMTLSPTEPPTPTPTKAPTYTPTNDPTKTPTDQPVSTPTIESDYNVKRPLIQPRGAGGGEINTPTIDSDYNGKRPLIQPRAGGENVKLRPNSGSDDNNTNNRKNGGDDAHPNLGDMMTKVSSRSKEKDTIIRAKNPRMASTGNQPTKKAKQSTEASSSSCDKRRTTTTERPTQQISGIMTELPKLVGGFFNRGVRRL